MTESTQPDKAIADFVRKLFDDHDNERRRETLRREAEKAKRKTEENKHE